MEKHIDYEAVIEILEEFLNTKKTEILGISVGEEIQVRLAIENLINRVKELEEFKKQVTEIENTNFIKYKNYIPKSKIRQNIEEIKETGCCKVNEYYKGQCVIICRNYSGCKALQELLGEEVNGKM